MGEAGVYVNCASDPVEIVIGPTVAKVVPQAFCATIVEENALLMVIGPTGYDCPHEDVLKMCAIVVSFTVEKTLDGVPSVNDTVYCVPGMLLERISISYGEGKHVV